MKIIHISDLHFGTERKKVLDALIEDIHTCKADAVVISGDLTQRAKASQFKAAKKFFNELNVSVLTVPGNHDIPLYNLLMRLLVPFKRYKKWISDNLCNYLQIGNVIIYGINSVTPFKPMSGYITDKQLNKVLNFFSVQPKDSIRVIVMHHNLIRSERHKIINDAEKIISVFAKANINLVLSGHIHSPHIELLKRNYLSHNMYIITAGTAISHRTILPNSYNIIEINDNRFKLTIRNYEIDKFVTASEEMYAI